MLVFGGSDHKVKAGPTGTFFSAKLQSAGCISFGTHCVTGHVRLDGNMATKKLAFKSPLA